MNNEKKLISVVVPIYNEVSMIDEIYNRINSVFQKIDSYEYVMVAQVDMSQNTVLDRLTWKSYGFDEGVDAEKINITKNGR